MPTFTHSGGLAEAACWQALRQDIYASMVHLRATELSQNYDQSSVFTFRDDAACANVVVLRFAKILRLAHRQEGQESDYAAWKRIADDVEAWNDRRNRLFQPIHYKDFDLAESRPFPFINLISPPQVAALQYYHACKTYLLLHQPDPESLSGFHAARRRRTLEVRWPDTSRPNHG
ncbi:hypothetical protein DOTSEDRAFT_132735 [Lecanosticta acicola]|uniref:Uncharacterized protein n=1 Tax=Lecanosticta acicola TaxID=111012 RepID=A0AAI9E9I1_9PEZI|nr:hypothetical protein DOTSEDRAFT_132735 [Lecanosticta acicola]